MQLSDEQRQQVLTQATLRAIKDKPALVADLFDFQNQLWRELPDNPYDKTYSKPWMLEYFGGSAGSQALGGITLVGDALAIAASVGRAPIPYASLAGGAIGLAGGAALVYRENLAEDRANLGKKLWNEDFNSVASMVSNGWALEKALVEIVSNNQAEPKMRGSARAALARMADWRIANNLPTQSTPLPQLLLSGGPVDQAVKDAAAAAAKAHDPDTQAEKYNSRFLAELNKTGASVEEVNKVLTPLVDDFKKLARAKLEEEARAELERRIDEVVATGQILGLVVGLGDRRAGQAVTTAFEQGAVLYKSIRALQAGFQIASLASGIGAAFAIAGAFSALGGTSNGPSPTEAILNAIQSVMDGLSKLGEKLQDIDGAVKSLSVRAAVNFASINHGLVLLSDQIVETERTMNAIKMEDIEADLFAAVRDFRTTGTAETAFELVKRAYQMAIFDASRDSQTGELESPTRLASMVWSLTDRNRTFADWSASGAALVGGPSLFATALERYPTLLVRATDWFLASDATRRTEFGDSLAVSSGLEDEMSKSALSNKRAVSPFIATSALFAVLDVARRQLLRPDLAKNFYPEADLQPDEMLRDIARVVQWPHRCVGALTAPETRAQARRAYFRAVEGLVGWVMAERLKASKLFPKLPPLQRYGLLMGADSVSGPDDFIKGYQLSFWDGGESPATPNDRGIPGLDSLLRSDKDLNAAGTVLDTLVAAGGALSVNSIRAWVDQPIAGQPEWFGLGEFHETYVVVASFASGVEVVALYLYAVDDGSASGYEPGYCRTIEKDNWTENELSEYRAARGRQARMWDHEYPSTNDINWGPFADLGYNAINDWLEDVKATAYKENLADLVGRMKEDGIYIDVYVGHSDLSGFARAKLFEAHTKEITTSESAKAPIPKALIEDCSRAWLNMVTVELAWVESGQGRIVPLLEHLYFTPPIVRGDTSLNSSVFGDEKTQQAFWGSEAAKLLNFWRFGPSDLLGLMALDETDFDSLVSGRYKDSRRPYAYISENTIRLHIPDYPSHDDRPLPSGGPATCLPLTHRAIAASNSFSLLAKQLTGWE